MDEAAEAWLEAVTATARACGETYTLRRGARSVEVEPRAAGGFLVIAEIVDDAVVVRLGPWERRFARETDPDDDEDALALAHDLVAAALWGRARLRIDHLGGKPWRTTVCFGAPGRWLTFDRVGGGLRWPWSRLRTDTHINAGRPPRQISEKKLRPLPWAPWAGVRGPTAPAPPPKELPVDGELDLHPFNPKEVTPLVREYIEQCRAKGITELRLVHGKGIGNLRRTVHALLDRHPGVAGYRLGGHGAGSWGATLVDLHPLDAAPPDELESGDT